jgi:hypothetical protein
VATILLQSTITSNPDDWDINRFSLLAGELRAAGHQVTARNRAEGTAQDPVLSRLDELEFDQLWLIAVDTGAGLTASEACAIVRFRERGGGVLTARDHQDLGSSLAKLGTLGAVNEFGENTADPEQLRDDRDNPDISWPNYHSGANGGYQPVYSVAPLHPVLCTTRTASGRIEWFPAHPHEGSVRATGPHARAIAQGRSCATGRRFDLAVLIDGETTPDGRPMGRAVAESSFHHFVDYNWDIDRGAPSFVTEPASREIAVDPGRLDIFKDYVRNVAAWLDAGRPHPHGPAPAGTH